ncbi:TetR/AcrR family transcriptional regulator [Hyphococcus sp.]|uniref:TetR/AcrR family transcriptional regulator n=1 Tax=Hyphococcus sp. TaxID=2038636 RepID=UPI003CCC2A14
MTARRRVHRAGKGRANVEIGRQAQKSASTRKLIVEAALRCLIKHGYSQTTTPRIAEEAGLSRGAMMHHFSNRLTVILAAIEHLHAKRLRAFRRAVSSLPDDKPHLHDALEAYWRHVTHPLFVAFHELSVAARTDKELDKILRPAKEAFYREWYKLAVDLFPEWQGDKESFDLALNLVQSTLEGMALSRLSATVDENAEAKLFSYLEDCLRQLMPTEMKNSKRYAAHGAND